MVLRHGVDLHLKQELFSPFQLCGKVHSDSHLCFHGEEKGAQEAQGSLWTMRLLMKEENQAVILTVNLDSGSHLHGTCVTGQSFFQPANLIQTQLLLHKGKNSEVWTGSKTCLVLIVIIKSASSFPLALRSADIQKSNCFFSSRKNWKVEANQILLKSIWDSCYYTEVLNFPGLEIWTTFLNTLNICRLFQVIKAYFQILQLVLTYLKGLKDKYLI